MMTGKHQTLAPEERNRLAIRAVIILFVVVVLFFAWVGLELLGFSQKIGRQQIHFHNSRLADQRRTDEKIAQLACLVVSQTNEDAPHFSPTAREAIHEFRKVYGCPPYSPAVAKNPFGKLARPHPKHHVPKGFIPTKVPGAPAPAPRSSPDRNRTPSGSRSAKPSSAPTPAPAPTPTHAPAPGPTSTSTPLLPGILCPIVGGLVLPCDS